MKTMDSTKAIGYEAKCLYQLMFKDRSIKRDTTYIILNTNNNIIKNDCDLDTNGNIIITGPNASGKTTILKTCLQG